mgnify:CR=1 FL=1
MSKSVARLVRQFEPDHYDLRIELDEKAMHFRGHARITGRKVGRPSQRITLHGNDLKITKASIVKHDKKGEQPVAVKRVYLQKTFHEIRLHTEAMLYPGNYVVELSFEAPITRGMTGIYPCFFKDGEEEKKLFATQFESHHAREAFPCIDEPEAKATFDLTLTTRTGVEVLSNTPVASQQERDGALETRFEKTPRMSAYLLAFVTGELQKKTARTKSGVEVNTWATVTQPADSLDFALDVATKSIEYFEDYFGVPYPLPKADHVALPDFSSGAMENWGLITYRERLLLAYAGETGQSVRESIALVIAHETSHQWFGNLVTMQWWNDLWLNESFANMMEYACIDALYPEWHVWNTFVSAEALSAFRRDAIAGVQSVRTDVHHPDEISSLFDPSIVYAKGGRLLWMLKNFLGDEAFRAGLSAYFKKHAYGNTTGDDLWAALSDVSGQDVGAFMTPWLTRSGFPVLSITQEGSLVTVTQEHYLDDPSKTDPERLWPVPLFANHAELPALMTDKAIRRKVPKQLFATLNGGGYGHYLVRYTTDTQKQELRGLIASKTLSEADRLLLLNSASMFARGGYDTFGSTLELLGAYEDEASEPVWDMMALVAGEARRFIDVDPSLESALKAFTSSLVTARLKHLGWEEIPGESASDTKLRALILSLAAYAEVPAVLDEATKRFEAFRTQKTPLPAELRSLIMAVPVKQHDTSAFSYLLDLHDSTNNSDLQSDIADALTATRTPKDAETLLARLKDPKLVKPQDADRWLVYLLRNRYTRAIAWQWMVDNWAWLEETYKHDKSYDYLPRYAAGCVNTPEYAEKFHALFDDKVSQPLLKRNIELGSEEIATRVAWLQRDLQGVQAFFKSVR